MAQKKHQKKNSSTKKVSFMNRVLNKVMGKKKVTKKVVKKVKKTAVKKVTKSLPKKKVLLKKVKAAKRPAGKKVVKKAAPKIVKKTKKVVVKKSSKKRVKAVVRKPVKKVVKKAAPKIVKKTKKVVVKKAMKKVVKKVKKPVAKVSKQVQPEVKAEEPKREVSHTPVLLNEVVAELDLPKKRVVVDGTLGLGGHSKAMLQQMPLNGKLLAFDLDIDHLNIAKKTLSEFGDRVVFLNRNFAALAEEVANLKLKGIDAILLDLGIASPHVDFPEKGFSFMAEGPLDMRFNREQELTAADVVNTYSEKELMRIFREYGEEPKARRIAMEIMKIRKQKPFKTTTQFANFIEKFLHRQGRIHPATRVFQALRIEVNHELDSLLSTLKQAVDLLRPKGRIAVISYHSLEDRIVKHFFKDMARDYINEPGMEVTTMLEPKLKIVTKKPIVPTEEEVRRNPRSRSAKLRVAEKI